MKLSTIDLPDKADYAESLKEELPEGIEIEEPWQGLKTWLNPINGFRVIRLHYSADPAKRSKEWRDNEKKKYGEAEWNREHELIWESIEGKAVYSDRWDSDFHTSKVSLGWNPKLPVCRGWDFGLNGACIFAQLFPHSRLFVLREAVSEDIDFETFVSEVNRLSLQWFPGATFIEFIDPTGRNRFGADGRTYSLILASAPLRARRIISGANDLPARLKGVNDLLKENVKGLPCYLVDPSCETLIRGFNGGYFFGYDKRRQLREKPEKNMFSHPHDANQYLCSKVRSTKLDVVIRPGGIQEPRYGKSPNPVDRMTAVG